MGLTPVYNWPYPELNNPPDGATQMKNLALGIESTSKAMDDKLRSVDVNFTPTLTGLTLGNGTLACSYRLLGSHMHVFFAILGAAASPTSAFTGTSTTLSIPFPSKKLTLGTAYWGPGGGSPSKQGVLYVGGNSNAVNVFAIRQTDLVYSGPGSVWGTAVWGTSGGVYGNILIPI